MPAPHKFARKLHEAIGDEAAEAMVDWMNRTDEHFGQLHREVAELRQDMNVRFAESREEMRVGFARLDAKIDAGIARMDGKFDVGFATVESAAAKRHAEFMKWTLGFWAASLVTYVGALVALAKVLR